MSTQVSGTIAFRSIEALPRPQSSIARWMTPYFVSPRQPERSIAVKVRDINPAFRLVPKKLEWDRVGDFEWQDPARGCCKRGPCMIGCQRGPGRRCCQSGICMCACRVRQSSAHLKLNAARSNWKSMRIFFVFGGVESLLPNSAIPAPFLGVNPSSGRESVLASASTRRTPTLRSRECYCALLYDVRLSTRLGSWLTWDAPPIAWALQAFSVSHSNLLCGVLGIGTKFSNVVDSALAGSLKPNLLIYFERLYASEGALDRGCGARPAFVQQLPSAQ
jgi:hypothetical protein